MANLMTPSEAFIIKNEVEDVLPSDSDFFDARNLVSSVKREDIALGSCPGLSDPCKLELDTQEVGSTLFDNKGLIWSIVHCSDGVTLPQLSGPKPILMVRKLIKKVIEELKAGIWRCSSCGKVEKSLLMLDLHIDTGCEELFSIECDLCPVVVHDYRDFVVHIIEHRMGKRRRCPICLRKCISDMRKHLFLEGHFSPSISKLDLLLDVPVAASQNPSASAILNLIESETKAKYLNNQKTCLNIHLIRKRQRKLKRHQIIHKGKKPHKCGVCQKSFSQLGHLNAHQRLHTGERPYKCDVCQKSFSESGNLNKHQRIHTGEIPYKCDMFQKSFSQLSNFVRHKRKHTCTI